MTKKAHILYAAISVCALVAYGGYLVKNAMTRVNTVEETLPYAPLETEFSPSYEFETLPPSEPSAQASLVKTDVPDTPSSAASDLSPLPTDPPQGFSPVCPTDGTVTASFSPQLSYNSVSRDWRSHPGCDFSSSDGNVFSVEDGRVISVSSDPVWGGVVQIDHGEYTSVYKGVKLPALVKENSTVRRGQKISVISSIPVETSPLPHLHFEMYHFTSPVDPADFFN